jgi:hypothetical protein
MFVPPCHHQWVTGIGTPDSRDRCYAPLSSHTPERSGGEGISLESQSRATADSCSTTPPDQRRYERRNQNSIRQLWRRGGRAAIRVRGLPILARSIRDAIGLGGGPAG